jgi:hypothetical protein
MLYAKLNIELFELQLRRVYDGGHDLLPVTAGEEVQAALPPLHLLWFLDRNHIADTNGAGTGHLGIDAAFGVAQPAQPYDLI